MTTQVQVPFEQFNNASGAPLNAGKIYIGQYGLNPLTSPATAYWDEAKQYPAAQPIRTSGGYPVRSGTPSQIFVDGAYSISVYDRNNVHVYSALHNAEENSYERIVSTATIGQTVFSTPSYIPRLNTLLVLVNGEKALPETDYVETSENSITFTTGRMTGDSVEMLAMPTGRLTPQHYGAVADGVDTGSEFTGTDNTAAFQAALSTAGACGEALCVPSGKYRFAANTTPDTGTLILNHSTHIIEGYGAELLIDDDAPTTYSTLDFIRSANLDVSTNLDDRDLLQIKGVTFKGRWAHSNYYPGTNVLTVQNFARVELSDVKAYDIPAKFSRSRYNGSVSVVGFEAKRIASDCLRFIDCPNVQLLNLTLFEIDDDCIALPSSNPELLDVRSRIMISNASIEKCEGILVVGARVATLSNITMRLCMGTQIFVGGRVGEAGTSSPHSLALSNITITDPLNRADGGSAGVPPTAMLTSLDAAIIVAGLQPTNGTTAARPEYYDAVSGSFVAPYQIDDSGTPILYNYGTSTTLACGYNIVVDGCTVMRTLPPVAAYSEWGLGLAFSRFGRYDPAVGIENWADNGIQLNGSIKNGAVSDCSVMGLADGAGIMLRSLAATPEERDREFENILIDGCTVRDCKYGVAQSATEAATASTWSVVVRDCTFDLDPFHTSAARTAPLDGSFQSGVSVFDRPIGVFFRQSYGWSIHNCSFANCYDPILANSNFFENADVKENILLCEPVDVGYSASNKGVAVIPEGGGSFSHFVIDADPTSSTYMSITTIPLSGASAVPTSGTYVKGHFVKNSNPTTSASKTKIGWVRQSTGAGHTVATTDTADWAPIVAGTS